MSTDKRQQSSSNNSEPSPELINACVKIGEAIESANASTDQAMIDFIQQNAAAAGENLKTAGAAVADFAVDVGEAAVDSAIETGSNWADSLLKNNARLSLEHQREQGFIGTKVDRTTFHFTTVQPICTANAVLRCSCGLAFGPLKVLPLHRVQIGTPPNPVATITDCLPCEINIPQFVLCFNILNPAVLALTTAATIAKGGVFTLTPAPCFGSMAPSPWIPTTKNTCGQTPLLTQASCSNCWGLGSINILHCGQGIQPGLINRFRVPGDKLATIQGYAESIVNLGSQFAMNEIMTPNKLAGPVGKAFQASKMGKIVSKYGLDAIEIVGNATTGIISALQEKTGDALSVATDLGFSLIGKRKKANAPKRRKDAQKDYTKAHQDSGDADERLKILQGENSPQAQANNRFNEADTARTTANENLQTAKEAQGKADKNLSDAQNAQKKADTELADAKTKQTTANDNYNTAKQAQEDAQRNVDAKKAKQSEAEEKVRNAEDAQNQADEKLRGAKAEKERIDNDPKSTDEQKAKAAKEREKKKKEQAKAAAQKQKAREKAKAQQAKAASSRKATTAKASKAVILTFWQTTM